MILGAMAVSGALWSAANAADPADHASRPMPGDNLAFIQPTDGLVIDIGPGLNLHPAHIGVSTMVLDPVPVMEVQWGRDVHVSLADGVSYDPVHLGPLSLGAIVEPKQDYAATRLTRGL